MPDTQQYITLHEMGAVARARAAEEDLRQEDLADAFDISQSLVSVALRGGSPRWTRRIYTHLTGQETTGIYYRIDP